VTLASHTLEWDLVAAGNWDVMLDALAQVKPTVAKRLRAAHVNSTQEVRADALLKAVKDRKGRFAQELAAIIADATRDFQIPSYLSDAIMWVTEEPAPPPPASPIDADAGADD
jgi:soluble lytic murein transglycosylase-like protein